MFVLYLQKIMVGHETGGGSWRKTGPGPKTATVQCPSTLSQKGTLTLSVVT